MQEKNIIYEIKEHLGVICNYDTGWTKELNVVSWNGSASKYDIRDWDPAHERMSRGITLHPTEMRALVDLYISANNRKTFENRAGDQEKEKSKQVNAPEENMVPEEKDSDIPFKKDTSEETEFDASPLVDEFNEDAEGSELPE